MNENERQARRADLQKEYLYPYSIAGQRTADQQRAVLRSGAVLVEWHCSEAMKAGPCGQLVATVCMVDGERVFFVNEALGPKVHLLSYPEEDWPTISSSELLAESHRNDRTGRIDDGSIIAFYLGDGSKKVTPIEGVCLRGRHRRHFIEDQDVRRAVAQQNRLRRKLSLGTRSRSPELEPPPLSTWGRGRPL